MNTNRERDRERGSDFFSTLHIDKTKIMPSSSSSSSSSHRWKYDVFVSFRGRELRKTFISHLFRDLERDKFRYFRDDDKDDIGEKIRVKLFRAIRHARFALVVFSENYAESKWCLNELVEILKCRRKREKRGHVVIPVFFRGVDATDLSNLTGESKFEQGFKKLCRKTRDKEQVRKWERALAKVKHISGFNLQNDANGNEAVLIKMIIEFLHEKFGQHAIKEGYERGTYAGGRQTTFRVSPDINSITIGFDRDGFLVCSVEHGRHLDSRNIPVELDYPHEHLTLISGQLRDFRVQAFRPCSHETYGAFGLEEGESIHFPQGNGGGITGPHGTFGGHLDPIGAHFGGDCRSAGKKSRDFPDERGIAIRCADLSKSITFEVNNATGFEPQNIYAANGRGKTFEVKMKHREDITLFSGYFITYNSPALINSLIFQTNKRISGPIDQEEGEFFLLPSKAGTGIGFFWRTGIFLRSTGVRLYFNRLYPFKYLGLFGWPSGSEWNDDNQHNTKMKIIAELHLSEKRLLRSLPFQYEEKNKELRQLKRHGGIDKNRSRTVVRAKTFMIQISYPKEYLTSISGYPFASSKEPMAGIRSLTFQTNKRMIEPTGDEEGRYFSSLATGGKIVGFYGWSGEHREAIGTYFEPILHRNSIESIEPYVGSSGETRDGSSGETWDHGKFKGVREIEVQHDINIHYIKFVYDGSNQSYQVTYKGCAKGDYPKVTMVILDYPQEYLTLIFGYTRDGAIQSFTFYSNKGRYGPFDEETGKYFWYPLNGNRITGFYGARDPDNETLKSIGLYVEPIPYIHPFKTVGPIAGSGGTEWGDGVHTDARGFRMSFDKAIKAIGIAYDNNGSFISGSEHGNENNNHGSSVSGLEPGERCKVLAGSCSIYHPRPENVFPESLLRAVHSGISAKAA